MAWTNRFAPLEPIIMPTFTQLDLSRRGFLRGAAVAASGGVVLAATAMAMPAQAEPHKVAQQNVNYQPTPKGKARCDGCAKWQAPKSCQVVAGDISPAGWCTVYAPKA
jgi:secreted PhoX family phosphatase